MSTLRSAPVALIYVRISQDREGAGLGVDRQREDCEKLAANLGMTVGRIYTDDDISAYSGKRRPGYERMLADIAAGHGDAVICWHTDRLYRKVREFMDYVDATNRRGVPTHGVTSGSVDLTTASGRLMALQFAGMAEYESAHKAERITRKHQQSAGLGVWRGGARPFGWGVDGEKSTDTNRLNRKEANLVRAAMADVIAARSLGAIIREWNDAGITSTTGNPWVYSTLRQVLLRPRNYGASVYKGEVVGAGQWEPITDEATWRTVKGILLDSDRRTSASNTGKHLLAGLALCGVCADGTTMISGTSTIRGQKYTIYTCRTGNHLARRADYCDTRVESVVFRIIAAENAHTLLAPDTGPDRAADIARAVFLRSQRKDLKTLWKTGVMTAHEVSVEDADLRAELAEIEHRAADPDRTRVLHPLVDAATGTDGTSEEKIDAVKEIWDHRLDWTQKREVIGLLMRVTVQPVPKGHRRRFDPAFVEVEPRRN